MFEDEFHRYHRRLNEDRAIIHLRGDNWQAKLRGHIYKTHLHPNVLCWFGVPKYDTDLATLLGVPLNRVAEKGTDFLERGWEYDFGNLGRPRVENTVMFDRLGGEWGEEWCKRMVVKSLRYIEQCQPSVVDWDRVHNVYPQSADIQFDLKRDWYDESFPTLSGS